ncbi:MAG: hypothetical protein U0L22_04460 [Bacteroidales bacterium]|nr:hypothetical protein [Bacteroidales bacterium]
MKKSYIADNIIREYAKKKRYKANKERAELDLFKRKVCFNCKNKKTDLCSIRRNIDGNLQCAFKE